MDAAVAAAQEIASAHGLDASTPRILRAAANLLVHLPHAGVVARIPWETAALRAGSDWLAREVSIASHLIAAGAAAVPPASALPPGPHRIGKHVLTFWEHVQVVGDIDHAEAGRRLRHVHEALGDYQEPLPRWTVIEETARLLAALGYESRVEELRTALEALPISAVHGDAHLGNVLQSAGGPLWNDWEDTFQGSRAWDLACLQAGRIGGMDAVRGYGAHDEDLHACLPMRQAQLGAWSVLLGRRGDRDLEARGEALLQPTATTSSMPSHSRP